MSTFKAMKFRVESPEQSKQIQEALFELGYDWQGSDSYLPLHKEANYIFAYPNGTMTKSKFAIWYDSRAMDETTLEELQEMVGNKLTDNNDLIKRIETLEKQMSMIHAYNTPLNAPPFRPEAKYATGTLVGGIDKAILHEKHVEFTEWLNTDKGWVDNDQDVAKFATKIVYLGQCEMDGDMFAVYDGPCIEIYKGHLNSGTY